MKKSVLYVFAILLALSSCSKEDGDHDILEEILKEWGITIPYQDVSKSKTHKLLENLLDNLSENLLPIQPHYSSSMPTLYLTEFNSYLQNNKEADVFFERKDCVSVLLSEYLTNLKTAYNWGNMDYKEFKNQRTFSFFEMLLSSDMFMYKMNLTEKVQLMVLALERAKYTDFCSPHPFTIMISIMLSSNYLSFINGIKPMLVESSPCFYNLRMDDSWALPGGCMFDSHAQATDLIIGYAKRFINDNK